MELQKIIENMPLSDMQSKLQESRGSDNNPRQALKNREFSQPRGSEHAWLKTRFDQVSTNFSNRSN